MPEEIVLDPGKPTPFTTVLGLARIALGLTFLWAFFDKLLGLKFTTPPEGAWTHGGSPTLVYLGKSFGPLGELFKGMAGNVVVDWLFMLGLLGVGLALTFGIGVRIGGISGALMMLFMYASHPVPFANPHTPHPFLDDHIIYGLVLLAFAFSHAGRWCGFGVAWENAAIVKKKRWLA